MFLVSGHTILALPKQKEVASSSNVCLSFRRILTRPIFPFSSFPSGFGRERDSAQTEWTMGTVLLLWAGTVGHIRGCVIMGGGGRSRIKRGGGGDTKEMEQDIHKKDSSFLFRCRVRSFENEQQQKFPLVFGGVPDNEWVFFSFLCLPRGIPLFVILLRRRLLLF